LQKREGRTALLVISLSGSTRGERKKRRRERRGKRDVILKKKGGGFYRH